MNFFNKLIQFFSGIIIFRIKNGFIERFLSNCIKNDITIWNTKIDDASMTGKCYIKDYKDIKEIAKKSNVEINRVNEKGFYNCLKKVKFRYGILLGLLIFIASIISSQIFIWSIKVSGNNYTSDTTIIEAVKKTGIKELSFIPEIDFRAKSDEALLELPQLSWLSINRSGGSIEIKVQERTSPPDIKDTTPCDVIAKRAGKIIYTENKNGDMLVKVGQEVSENETLISGIKHFEDNKTLNVHANGIIIAESKIEKIIKLSEDQYNKEYYKEKNLYNFKFFSCTLPLYINFKQKGEYDVTKDVKYFSIFKNEIPIGIENIKYKFYKNNENKLTKLQAEKILNYGFLQYENSELNGALIIKKEESLTYKNNEYVKTIIYIIQDDITMKSKLQEIVENNKNR